VNAVDPGLDCTGLNSAYDYVVEVTGTGASCDLIPGNAPNCSDPAGYEDSSSPIPYYIITAYDPDSSSSSLASETLASSSLAPTTYLNLPSCGALSLAVSTGQARGKGGACCGSLRDISGGPSGPASFWLAVILSPLTWFALWWVAIGRRKDGEDSIA
jgi:hypothetical protein